MCIDIGDSIPCDTTLISTIVQIQGKLCQLMVYENTTKNNAAMVIGVPAEINEIILFKENKLFIEETQDNVQSIEQLMGPKTRGLFSDSFDDCEDDMAKVITIGNYNISIVNTISEIDTRVNWSLFKRPQNYERLISVLNDKNVFSDDHKWSYIIAQSNKPVVNTSFSFSFPISQKQLYFPTCHEGGFHEYNYDVQLCSYHREPVENHNYKFGKKILYTQHGNFNLDFTFKGKYYTSEKQIAITLNGNYNLSIANIKGNGPNLNVFA